MMTTTTTITLPHGIEYNGTWVRNAKIHQLTGYDEQYLSQIMNYPLPFITSALLERTVNFEYHEFDLNKIKIIRSLTVGDRIALMLHLRRITFGNKFQFDIYCSSCNERLSSDLSISTLILPPKTEPRQDYELRLDGLTLKIRPIRGIDLENIHNNNNYSDVFKSIIRSCIVSSQPSLPDNDLIKKIENDESLFLAISSKLEEIDPQADILLNLVCLYCQHQLQIPFNTEEFIIQEIVLRETLIEREIHWLAFNYHWDENSILSLPMAKRKRYVELINVTLAGESI